MIEHAAQFRRGLGPPNHRLQLTGLPGARPPV
jgi:hypothetical protein